MTPDQTVLTFFIILVTCVKASDLANDLATGPISVASADICI